MIVYIDYDQNGVVKHVGTTPIGNNPTQVEVDSMDIFTSPTSYVYADGVLTKSDNQVLAIVKQAKDDELNAACNQSIMSGFDYEIDGVTYHFSYDLEAQSNFLGAYNLFKDGLITSVDWTVKDPEGNYTRITINKELMDNIRLAALQHTDGNITKYRNVLLPQVAAATTIDEVNAITWDSVSPQSSANISNGE